VINEKLAEKLNATIKRAIDRSPCDYVDVIEILENQLKFMREAQEQEHPQKRLRREAPDTRPSTNTYTSVDGDLRLNYREDPKSW